MITERAFPDQFIIGVYIAFYHEICIGRHFNRRLGDTFTSSTFFLRREIPNGIENYTRILDGRMPGDRAVLPAGLLPRGLRLLMIDESHQTAAADRRHVRGRPPAQADADRLRLPAAESGGQPAADA